MKQALISPAQPAPRVNGPYVVEVTEQSFPVAEPMFWTDCPDDCMAYAWWYDEAAGQVKPIPAPPPPEQPAVTGAQEL